MNILNVQIEATREEWDTDDISWVVRLYISIIDDNEKRYSLPWMIKEFDSETEAALCAKNLRELFV